MIAFLCKDIERRNKKRAVLAPCLGAAGVANPPPLDQLRNGIVRPLCSGDRSQNGTPGAADTGLPAETPLCSTLPLCLSRDKRSDQIFNKSKRQNRIANTQKRREALKPPTAPFRRVGIVHGFEQTSACKKTPPFSQLFLCLSRACLGKMIIF